MNGNGGYPEICHLPPDGSGAVYITNCAQQQVESLDSLPTPEPVYSVPPITVTATQNNLWLLVVVVLAVCVIARRRR